MLGPEPTRFDDLLIEGNRIADVSRSGIFIVGTADSDRPRAGQPWPAASTRVRVRANRLARLGGDGIVPLGTRGRGGGAQRGQRGEPARTRPLGPARG